MRLNTHRSPTQHNATRRRRALLAAAIGAGVTSIVAATFVGLSADVGDAQRPLVTNITVTEPPPSLVADHFVLYHPVSDPTAVEVAHVGGNAPNGTFVHAQRGSAGETYRLIVVALFDPASVEGASAMDQAKTVATDGC
jgi:hypothetical protein